MRVLTFSYKRHRGAVPSWLGIDKVIDCRVLDEPWEPMPVAKRLLKDALAYARRHPHATIAFGCDWGQQRSVETAEAFATVMGIRDIEHTARYDPADDEICTLLRHGL